MHLKSIHGKLTNIIVIAPQKTCLVINKCDASGIKVRKHTNKSFLGVKV